MGIQRNSECGDKRSVFIRPLSYKGNSYFAVEVKEGNEPVSGCYYIIDPFWNGENKDAPPDYYLINRLSYDKSNYKESLLVRVVNNDSPESLEAARKFAENLARRKAMEIAQEENIKLIDLLQEGQETPRVLVGIKNIWLVFPES